jgi:CspA family cold shock protein
MQGRIRMWNHTKGLGFVESNESRDVFIHFSEIRNRRPEQMEEGDSIEFDLGADREGRLCAKNARVLDRPTTDCSPIRFGDIGCDGAA